MITCNRCGNKSPDDAVFCDQCGGRLSEQAAPAVAPEPSIAPAAPAPVAPPRPVVQPVMATEPQDELCPSCGASVTPGEMFCSECGARLAEPTPAPVASPEPAVAVSAPAAPAAVATDKCPFCGAKANPGEEYCYACGARFEATTAPSQLDAAAVAAPVVAAGQGTAPSTTPVAAPATPVADASPTCAACGAQLPEGQAFCPFCGAAVVGAPNEAFATPVGGQQRVSSARLVVAATNIELPLTAGSEIVVGREDPYSGVYPDVDLTPHGGEEGGVSRRHFKIYGLGNQYTIEDLNSTNLTLVNQARLQPGVRTPLHDGDEVRAGRVKLVFRVD